MRTTIPIRLCLTQTVVSKGPRIDCRGPAFRHKRPLDSDACIGAQSMCGQPTTDAKQAVKGLLLAFGGARGANIAMIMEILAAGMTGANWSIDAPHYAEGSESPGVGLFLVVFRPDALVHGFADRLSAHLSRLEQAGVRIPGSHIKVHEVDVPADVMDRVRAYIG